VASVIKTTKEDLVVTGWPKREEQTAKVEKLESRWTVLTEDEKKRCMKAVIRFILFKAGKQESFTTSDLTEVLGTLDEEGHYKKHAKYTLHLATSVLPEKFGIALYFECDLPQTTSEKRKTTSDRIFATNDIKSPALLKLLGQGQNDRSAAFTGFAFVVLHMIFNAPGRTITAAELLTQVRFSICIVI
jgi:hypothetical protein